MCGHMHASCMFTAVRKISIFQVLPKGKRKVKERGKGKAKATGNVVITHETGVYCTYIIVM